MQAVLRVADVLSRPLFHNAKTIAGLSGLNHIIRWVHILDIPEALAHLNGSELVLTTGMGFGENTAGFITFLEQLITGRAAGLCIELGTAIQEIPHEIIDMANRAEFPLIVFPTQVRFVDITQDVHKLILVQERHAFYEQDWVEQQIRGHGQEENIRSIRSSDKLGKVFRTAVITIPEMAFAPSIDMNSALPDVTADWFQWKADLSMHIRTAFTQHAIRPYLSIRTDTVVALLEMANYPSDQHERYAEWHRRITLTFQTLQHAFLHMGWKDTLCIGIGSEIRSLSNATHSYANANIALGICQQVKGVGWLPYEETGIYRFISLFSEHPDAASYRHDDLTRILEYDRDHHANLLETLKVYLDCDRSKQRTADALFIHRQTFYHRLDQLEQILHVNLDDPVQRLSLHLSIYFHWFHQHQSGENG
jgi:hypothetical protein